MSCKHEFESLRTADGSFCMTACRKCMKSTGEIETLFKAENRIAAANARIAELTAERQRDALDGQAALDEANSRITSYEQQFGEYCKGAKSDVDYWKKRAEKAEAKAKQLIKKLTYNTPSFRDGKCDEELLTIDENELVPLKSCMCDRLKQAESKLISHAPDGNQYSNAQFIAMRQKAEQAEAQCNKLRNCGNCDKWRDCWGMIEEVPCMEVCHRWENAKNTFVQDAILADNKRMREALESIIIAAPYYSKQIAKAALEGNQRG